MMAMAWGSTPEPKDLSETKRNGSCSPQRSSNSPVRNGSGDAWPQRQPDRLQRSLRELGDELRAELRCVKEALLDPLDELRCSIDDLKVAAGCEIKPGPPRSQAVTQCTGAGRISPHCHAQTLETLPFENASCLASPEVSLPAGRSPFAPGAGAGDSTPEEGLAQLRADKLNDGCYDYQLQDSHELEDIGHDHPNVDHAPSLKKVASRVFSFHGIQEYDDKTKGSGFGIRHVARVLIHRHQLPFDVAIGMVILVNSALIGWEIQLDLDGEYRGNTQKVLSAMETCFLVVYISELFLRALADGTRVLQSRWFAFDATLVCVGLTSAWILRPIMSGGANEDGGQGGANKGLHFALMDKVLLARNLRLVRLVRAVRMMDIFADLWRLSVGLFRSARTVASACVLVAMVGYIFACFGIELITMDQLLMDDPVTGPIVTEFFGSIPRVLLTLIQFVNADSIGAIYTPLIQKKPALALYFGLLVVVVTILLMNLVTASVVESAVRTGSDDHEMQRSRILKQIAHLAPKVEEAFSHLDVSHDGFLDKAELEMLSHRMEDVHLPEELVSLLHPDKLRDLFEMIDVDDDGRVTAAEFIEGVCTLAFSNVPTEFVQILHLLRQQRSRLATLHGTVRGLQEELLQQSQAQPDTRGCTSRRVEQVVSPLVL